MRHALDGGRGATRGIQHCDEDHVHHHDLLLGFVSAAGRVLKGNMGMKMRDSCLTRL